MREREGIKNSRLRAIGTNASSVRIFIHCSHWFMTSNEISNFCHLIASSENSVQVSMELILKSGAVVDLFV